MAIGIFAFSACWAAAARHSAHHFNSSSVGAFPVR